MMVTVVGGLMLRGAIGGDAVAAGSDGPSVSTGTATPTLAAAAGGAPYLGLTRDVWPPGKPVVTLPFRAHGLGRILCEWDPFPRWRGHGIELRRQGPGRP